ncbi:MAG: tRNA (adenosine(37)-N6)-dimethylallyltransferase MiaA [Lachnospiraceae bacterium]|nr:tRNA (adenosine(37)-N6)-dimethylallyltransferase MiaA [Lachnospiraceae bacterium]
MKKPLVIISGPTAVGKTDISINLAKKINGEIISADSIQIYKKMDIGSAKIRPEEMQGVTHYMIDELEPDEDFNVYKFKELSLKYLDVIYSKGKIPIIVGGTGFYVQALLYDVDFAENEEDDSIRKELYKTAEEKGANYLHKILEEIDPESAAQIHENNIKRVARAIEYYKQTGYKISEHNKEQWQKESPYNFAYFVLNRKREELYDRINKRVDIMHNKGIIDEVANLKSLGYSRNLTSMQGIGYKEIYAFLDGECSEDEAFDKIKQNTRHFAKRQLTWFRREKCVEMLEYEDFSNDSAILLDEMIKRLKNKNII